MNIPVLIEPIPGFGFRATGTAPFATTAEGATPEEAVAKLRQSLEQRLAAGARLVTVQLREAEHPWLPYAGMFSADDADVGEWRGLLESRRSDVEAE